MQAVNLNRWLVRSARVTLVIGAAAYCAQVSAQQNSGPRRAEQATDRAKQESTKIEPYTGEPIYLTEAQQSIKPAVVRHETRKENYDDGTTVRVERVLALYSDDSFAADGRYREFHPNSKPFVTGQFKAGRQEGEWAYYHENGQLNRKTNYSNGKLDGNWDVFRADGTLLAKRGFKEGVRDGDWITYDATGKQPLAEERYVKGQPDGEWKATYPDGKPKQVVTFKQGKRDGKTAEWDDKGQKLIEAEYKDGQLDGTLTRFLPGGKSITQIYKEGRFVSESKQ